MQELLTAIDKLSIVDVQPKPQGLSQNLMEGSGGMTISMNDRMSLQSKGFYLTREGDLKSNEGELQVHAADGVVYTLRFGEVLYGSGLGATAGGEESQKAGAAENRYLFITTDFDPSQLPEPNKPAGTAFLTKPDSLWTDADREQKRLLDAHESWKQGIERGRKHSDDLNTRFADWYYVISAASFDKLHLTRKDLVGVKKSATEEKKEG